jgi:hypothetical protein
LLKQWVGTHLPAAIAASHLQAKTLPSTHVLRIGREVLLYFVGLNLPGRSAGQAIDGGSAVVRVLVPCSIDLSRSTD